MEQRGKQREKSTWNKEKHREMFHVEQRKSVGKCSMWNKEKAWGKCSTWNKEKAWEKCSTWNKVKVEKMFNVGGTKKKQREKCSTWNKDVSEQIKHHPFNILYVSENKSIY